jgi:Flp pilus assembly protein TadG
MKPECTPSRAKFWPLGRLARSRRRAFVRDERGVTAIEFGLLALPFFAIVGAILETSLVFMAGEVLDSAVQDTSRLIRTGQAQAAALTVDGFRDQVCSRLYNLFADCDQLHVDVQVVDSFQSATVTAPVDYECEDECDEWTRPERYPDGYAAGSSAVMLVQVYYKWPVMLDFAGLSLANLPDGKRLLGAATVFRNEPFPSS